MVEFRRLAGIGKRQKLHHVRADPAQPAHGNPVAGEGPEPDLILRVAVLILPVVQQVEIGMREIALPHRGGRHRQVVRRASGSALPVVRKGRPEEGPVPPVIQLGNKHRPARGDAEFVVPAVRPLRGLPRTGIQERIVVEIPDGAVELIGAGLGSVRDQAAATPPVFGGRVAEQQLVLSDRFDARLRVGRLLAHAVVGAFRRKTIQQDDCVERARTGYVAAAIRIVDAWREPDVLVGTAFLALDRYRGPAHQVLLDRRAHRRVGRLELGNRGGNAHLLRDSLQPQFDIERGLRGGSDQDPRDDVLAEALGPDGEVVGSERQENHVLAYLVRGDGLGDSRSWIEDLDLGAWDDGP